MKKHLVILTTLTLFFSSCSKHKKTTSFSENDSISHYYSLSKNKKLSYAKRLASINRCYEFIKESATDSLQLVILDQKTKIHFGLDQYDSVQHFNSLLYRKSTEINNIFYKARYHFVNSYYYEVILPRKDSAFSNINKSIAYYALLKDSSNIGKRHLDLAYMQYDVGDYFSSIESGTKALMFLSKKNDTKYIASSHSVIANNYEELQMYNYAEKNYRKSISLAPSLNDKFIYKNNLATMYNDLFEHDKAVQMLASINLDSIKDTIDKTLINENLIYSKWLKDPTKKIESSLKENLTFKKKKHDYNGLSNSYEYLATYFIEKNSQKATYYAHKLTANCKAINNPEGELMALKILMKINDNDLVSKNSYIQLKDSITSAHLKTRNQYAKIKYDNSQTLEDNKNLTQKNKHQKLLKSLYALLALITVIILLFYLNYSHQKRKQAHLKFEQEKLQTVYKTETDISKKIHDEIANGIYQVMIHAQNENNPLSEKSIDKLDQIYKRTRDFSHQISDINVNEDYLIELQGMLEDYESQNTSIVVSGINSILWDKISKIKKETVYRVLNELMVNMTKHSQAHLVILKFSIKKNELNISYSDDGIGLIPNQFVAGTGLRNMENRIHSIQGSFNFENNLEQGLHISIVFPA